MRTKWDCERKGCQRVIGDIVIIIIFFKVLGLVKTEDVIIGMFVGNWRIRRQNCALQEENLT